MSTSERSEKNNAALLQLDDRYEFKVILRDARYRKIYQPSVTASFAYNFRRFPLAWKELTYPPLYVAPVGV